MRVTVDGERCHGHQMCAIASPKVFGSDEYGNAVVLLDPVPVDLETTVRRAEANCPERAITLHDAVTPDEKS
jgi:ferredoxin